MAMALVPAVLTLNVSPCSFSVALDRSQGRARDKHQCRDEVVADPSRIPGIGDRLEALDQAGEVCGVEIDLCHLAPLVWEQQRMVEGPSEHLGTAPVQRTDVDVLDLAVGDIAAGATRPKPAVSPRQRNDDPP